MQFSTLNSAVRISFTEKKTGEQNLEEDTHDVHTPLARHQVGLRLWVFSTTQLRLSDLFSDSRKTRHGPQSRNRHRLYWPSLAFERALLSRPIYPRQRINKLRSLAKLLSRLQKVRAKPLSRIFIFQIMKSLS